jgi:hypothetical protein
MLLASTRSPWHVVEEQVVDVARREPVEFVPGTMREDMAQPADLGVDART